MSNYRGHLYGGTVTFLLVLGVLSLGFFLPSAVELLSLFAICLFASLLPDIDTKSVGQKLFYRLLFAADALLILARYYR
ncbi:MAG: metal-dependent hydrolase, partial [Nitrospinota bacterium]